MSTTSREDLTVSVGKHTIILGAGAFARELWGWLTHHEINIVAFFDDTAGAKRHLNHIPVIDELAAYKDCIFLIGAGDPKTKIKLDNKARSAGLIESPYFLHESVTTGAFNRFAMGAIVCPNTVITCDTTIGRHAMININCTIGHDVWIGDYATVSPGACINGRVHLGDGAAVGAGAVIREGIKIGKGAVVGAGAVVVRDVPPGVTVVGNPARDILLKTGPKAVLSGPGAVS